jgi:hypothetical protein
MATFNIVLEKNKVQRELDTNDRIEYEKVFKDNRIL